MDTFTYMTCPECNGRGLIATSGEVRTTCATCQGVGVSLQNTQQTIYQFPIPLALTASSHDTEKLRRSLRYTLASAILVLFFISLLGVLAQTSSLEDVFWHTGFLHLLLGISGLGSMYAVTAFEHHQTSQRSLDQLPQTSEKPIDLFEYANPRLRLLLTDAARLAVEHHSSEIDDTTLLTALFNQSRIQTILGRMELPLDEIMEETAQRLSPGHEAEILQVHMAPEAKERLYQGFLTALTNHFPYIDLEDILLSYLRDPRTQAPFFAKYHLEEKEVYAITRWYAEDQDRSRQWAFWRERGRSRPGGFMNRAWTALPTPFLDQYSVDITSQAGDGLIASANAHKAQVDRVLEILGGTKQNSVILVGEPGVGKASIVGGVALRMLEENVPEVLKDKRLVQLDATTLLSSEAAEESVQHIVEEVAQAGNVILAIPNLQVLAGSPNSPLTPAVILANALGNGVVQVISTATYAEYHHFLEHTSSLTSAITLVEVPPASSEQTLQILEEEAPGLENRHSVLLTMQALEAAVSLAEQYLPEMAAPSGAVTLLGDAASSCAAQGKKWVQRTDVEQAIEKRTSIPVRAATLTEKETLLNLEENLHKRVIGQNTAITAIASALRRSRAGLGDKKRPIASFLFVGPTGVGKTETAKAVGDLMFGAHGHFLRFDMSEYQDPTSAYRLIGAPTATGEQGEGGELTKAVREHPYSLILFDELEKAEPHVLDLFLQLLEDGRLTENTGRTVHFQNCLIVATSNAGSSEIIKLIQEKIAPEKLPKQVVSLLQNYFKPEFLNRFDAIVPFEPLGPAELDQVVNLMLAEVVAKSAAQGITLQFDPGAIKKIAELGYDPLYGARPLRRVIQDKVESMLANYLLQDTVDKSKPLQITAEMIQ